MAPDVRKERDRQIRRKDILDAAAKVFAARGFHAATVQEIAKAAQYGTGTVYLYFKDKDEIYRALVESGIDCFLDRVKEKTSAIARPIEKLRCFIDEKLKLFDAHRDFMKIYIVEHTVLPSGSMNSGILAKQTKIRDFVAGIIKDMMKEKTIASADPQELSYILAGMSNFVMLKWALEGRKGPIAGKAGMIMDMFLNGCKAKKAR